MRDGLMNMATHVFVGSDIERIELLNLVPLHGHAGNAEAGILRYLDGVEFCGITLLMHCAERASQSPADCFLLRPPEAPSGA